MERVPVESSNIKSVGYDDINRVLEVEFHHGGIYHYVDVPGALFKEFLKAPSKGKFFYAFIKEKFSYKRIN